MKKCYSFLKSCYDLILSYLHIPLFAGKFMALFTPQSSQKYVPVLYVLLLAVSTIVLPNVNIEARNKG